MLHHYVITEPVKELTEREQELPSYAAPGHTHVCEEANSMLVGPYETEAAHAAGTATLQLGSSCVGVLTRGSASLSAT
jgi:hypothetical protein